MGDSIENDWHTNCSGQPAITVGELLRTSGFGQIWKASYDDQPCVLKYMRRNTRTSTPFFNEVKCLKELQGNTLFPKLLGHGITKKAYYIFMPFYENGDLMDFIFNEIDATHTSIQSAVTTNNIKMKNYVADILLAIDNPNS